MAFKSIHDQNPFVIPGLFFACLLLLRSYFINRPGPYRPYAQRFGRKSVIFVTMLLGVCMVLVPVFEAYFRIMECEVSQQYMEQNIDLAQRAMTALAAHNIPYWLDYATLLNELRGQQLNRWEQDVDLSTIHPAHLVSMRNLPVYHGGAHLAGAIDHAKKNPDAPGIALNVEDLLQKFRDDNFVVTYLEDRGLIQLWNPSRKGPHVDLWLWSANSAEGPSTLVPSPTMFSATNPPVMWSAEEITYNHRKFKDIFPLNNATWLDMEVFVPNDKHEISKLEYGRYGGSYMTAQVFRGDCFHNFFQLKYFYQG